MPRFNKLKITGTFFDVPFEPSIFSKVSPDKSSIVQHKPNREDLTVDDFSISVILTLPNVGDLRQANMSVPFDELDKRLSDSVSFIEKEVSFPDVQSTVITSQNENSEN